MWSGEERSFWLATLSTAHHRRFLHDHDASIDALRDAMPLLGDDFAHRAELCADLSMLLRMRYRQQADPADLDEAIAYARIAPGGHPAT